MSENLPILNSIDYDIIYNHSPYSLSRYKKPDLLNMCETNLSPNYSKIAYVCSIWLKTDNKRLVKCFSKLLNIVRSPEMTIRIVRDLKTIFRNFLLNSKLPVLNQDFILNEDRIERETILDARNKRFTAYCIAIYLQTAFGCCNNLEQNRIYSWITTFKTSTRRACIKEFLPEHIKEEHLHMYELLLNANLIKAKTCCICLDDIKSDVILTQCGHMFHSSCITRNTSLKCPICRQLIH